MKKKIISAILCVALIAACLTALSACNDGEKTKIVYLGDSIAEAIIGPSPISERENNGYYAVIGKRNDYLYINRSVSGHQTKNMLAYIQEPDDGAAMTQSHMKTADIISISILGNDLLQTNLGETIYLVAKEDYTKLNELLATAATNFDKIIKTIRGYNPDATILVQTLYNPVSEINTMASTSTMAALESMGIYANDMRALGTKILNMLNAIIRDYLTANPNAYYIVDVQKAFGDIYLANAARGKGLIFPDGVHPSNEGHAVIADTIQAKLEELQLADNAAAIKKYKSMRIEQIKNLYSDVVDVKAVNKKIKNATSCSEITEIYFAETKDKVVTY